MRTTTIAIAVLGVLASTLTSAAPGSAASRYDARAALSGHRTCTRTATEGVTRRPLVLDNSRSRRRVQFKVVRDGDRYAAPAVFVWVRAGRRKTVMVSVPQRRTVSVRVRVPEMGRDDLRLSATVAALARCYVPTLDPRASLGGVACSGRDSVARIVLDNRATSDERVAYTVTSSYGSSTASFRVDPASMVSDYLPVPAGGSTHVRVSAAGRSLLAADVAAVSCP